MMHTQAMSLLALRRLPGRLEVSGDSWPPRGEGRPPGDGATALLPSMDERSLAQALQQAGHQVWLTLEILLARDEIAPQLDRSGQEALASLADDAWFVSLATSPAPFLEQLRHNLHTARKSGALDWAPVDMEDLVRQLEPLGPSDASSLRELEWFALWQMAHEVGQAGFPGLKALFEARTGQGDFLLVELFMAFLAEILGQRGQPAPYDPDLPSSLRALVGWVVEQTERLEQLLEKAEPRRELPLRGQRGKAETHVRQGLACAQQGDYERAALQFTMAIQADPGCAAAFLHRGDASRFQGDYDRAVADYTAALRCDPNSTLAYLNRGTVHRLKGQYDLAEADFTALLRLDPRSALAYSSRGLVHAQQGHHDQALADYSQALALDPTIAWTYQGRGDAHAGKGDYTRAIADYSEALRLNPHLLLALLNRGDAWRLMGEFDRAVADYSEALRLDPANPRTYLSRGDAYRRRGQCDQALADLGEALRLDPANPSVYLSRGSIFQQLGQYDRAVAEFDQAEQLDTDNPEIYLQRAQAYQSQEAYDEAVADLTRVIELNPRDSIAYLKRGTVFAIWRFFNGALADFTAAIRLDPRSAQPYLERARVQALAGTLEPALADCDKALQLDPEFLPARLVRGGVLLQLSRSNEAIVEFTAAITINPRYARAYNDRGVAHSRLDHFEEALADFSKAVQINPDNAQALANRANAFQRLGRQEQALQDFTQAVQFDSKYAAAYCVQRAIIALARDEVDTALADLAVALKLAPDHSLARSWWEKAQRQRETHFELNLRAKPAARESAPAASVRTPTETQSNQPATPTGTQVPVPVETQLYQPAQPNGTPISIEEESVEENAFTLVAEPPDEEAAGAEEDDSAEREFEEEQRRFQQLEAQKALVEAARTRAKLEEEKRHKEEAARNQLQREAQRRKRQLEIESGERWPWWYWATGGVAAAVLLVLVWTFSTTVLGRWLPQGPPLVMSCATLSAEDLVKEYQTNTRATNIKYGERMLTITGKIKEVQLPSAKQPNCWVLLEVPPSQTDPAGKWAVACRFPSPDKVQQLTAGQEITVFGSYDGQITNRPRLLLTGCELLSKKPASVNARMTPAIYESSDLFRREQSPESLELYPQFFAVDSHNTPHNLQDRPVLYFFNG